MKYVFSILLVAGLIGFSAYELIQLVRVFKEKRKNKLDKKKPEIIEKGDDKE